MMKPLMHILTNFFVQIAPATDANTNQFSFQQTGAEQEQQGFNF